MQSTTLRRLADVADATPVPNFKRLVAEFSKYFRSRSVSSPRFQHDDPDPLPGVERIMIADETVEVRSRQGKLLALCCDLSVSRRRSYARIIDELVDTRDKGTRFFLLGVVLSNLQYVHAIGEHEQLRMKLVERVEVLQEDRLRLEENARPWSLTEGELQSVRGNIELEVQYLFCLALACFLDVHFDYVGFAQQRLCCGLEPGALRERPQNLLAYFTDDRVLWCISLILHLSRPSRKQKRNIEPFASVVQTLKSLTNQVEKLHRETNNVPEETRDRVAADLQAAKSTLQLLLSDLGHFSMRRDGEVIRYLHKELIVPRKRHNPIDTTLTLVTAELQKLLIGPVGDLATRTKQRIALKAWCGGDENRVRQLQEWLDQGRRTAAMLEEIADAAIRLFGFATISHYDAGRFAVESGGSEFAVLVRDLGDILARARLENQISVAQITKADSVWGQISEALWGPLSPLRKVLGWYATDIRTVLLEEMEQANRSLESHGFKNVWSNQITLLKQSDAVFPALIDTLFLRDVLRNLLRNVRHSFEGSVAQEGSPWAEQVNVTLVIVSLATDHDGASRSDDVDPGEADQFVRLVIESFGKAYSPPTKGDMPSTLAQQIQRVDNLGGSLEVAGFDHDGRSGTRAVLRLHTRRRVFERIKRDPFL